MKQKTVALLVAILLVLSVMQGRQWSERFMARWFDSQCGCSRAETISSQ